MQWFQIRLEYAPNHFYQEALCSVVGAVANTTVFTLNFTIAWGMKKAFDWYPKYYHNIICWMGIYSALDPFITLFIDCVTSNTEWGDYFIFYNYFLKDSGSANNGAIGIYLTFFIFIAIVIFNGYVFYFYMVFLYMDGRILDLFRRLSGTYNTFFLPQDNEISLKYLQWVITRAKKKNRIIQSERKTIYDKYGIDRLVNFITIYKIEEQITGATTAPKNVIKKHRLFFKDFDGSLLEVKQAKITIKKHELNKMKSMVHNPKGMVTGHGAFSDDAIASAIEETENHMLERENPALAAERR